MKKIYNRIHQITGNVITVKATEAFLGELARVESVHRSSLAEVIRIYRDEVSLQVFAGNSGVSTHDKVQFLKKPLEICNSHHLLGRIFDGKGAPRDHGPMLTGEQVQVGGPTVNPAKRIIPSKMIHTGIPMIDIFNSLVESQKISIFTTSGEPFNELLARIALQAEVDILLIGGMGLRYDDFLYFQKMLAEGGALQRTVMFIHTASDPTVECLMIPDLTLAVAESFALQRKRVLVLLSDMTNFCDALKEIAIIMEQVPSNRSYPGDLYSQLAARYEKAVDFDDAGSITILSVTTMPGNDVTHPVPDNTGYITEGQYYLNRGHIEPFGSLSRLKQLVNKETREDHRIIMDSMVRLYSQYQDSLEKKAMGFKMTPWDDKLLHYGSDFEHKIMDLSVHLPLFQALDLCWVILADHFQPEETGITTSLISQYWPKRG